MDKQKLRKLMRDQISSFEGDIHKKLNYLVTSEMLDYNYYKIDIYRQKLNFTDDSDFLNAFIGNSENEQVNHDNAFANAFISTTHSASPVKNNKTPDANERILRVASRLTALRGISMPGDYLRKQQ